MRAQTRVFQGVWPPSDAGGNYVGNPITPASNANCILEQLQNDCVAQINKYRAGTLKFSNGQADTLSPHAQALIHAPANYGELSSPPPLELDTRTDN